MLRSMAILVIFISFVASISGCGQPAEPNAPPRIAESPAPPPAPPGASPRVKMITPMKTVTPTAVGKQRPAGKSATSGELEFVEAVQRGDLAKVVRTELSPDGKFLYAICWNPGALLAFARDSVTGKLTHVQTIDRNPEFAGATGLALSPDGSFAVSVAFRSKAVILFHRNSKSGELTRLESAPRKPQDVEFPVAAKFSPDGKFVCIADNGVESSSGGVRVYRLEGEKLVDVGMDQGRGRCFQGGAASRSILMGRRCSSLAAPRHPGRRRFRQREGHEQDPSGALGRPQGRRRLLPGRRRSSHRSPGAHRCRPRPGRSLRHHLRGPIQRPHRCGELQVR